MRNVIAILCCFTFILTSVSPAFADNADTTAVKMLGETENKQVDNTRKTEAPTKTQRTEAEEKTISIFKAMSESTAFLSFTAVALVGGGTVFIVSRAANIRAATAGPELIKLNQKVNRIAKRIEVLNQPVTILPMESSAFVEGSSGLLLEEDVAKRIGTLEAQKSNWLNKLNEARDNLANEKKAVMDAAVKEYNPYNAPPNISAKIEQNKLKLAEIEAKYKPNYDQLRREYLAMSRELEDIKVYQRAITKSLKAEKLALAQRIEILDKIMLEAKVLKRVRVVGTVVAVLIGTAFLINYLSNRDNTVLEVDEKKTEFLNVSLNSILSTLADSKGEQLTNDQKDSIVVFLRENKKAGNDLGSALDRLIDSYATNVK